MMGAHLACPWHFGLLLLLYRLSVDGLGLENGGEGRRGPIRCWTDAMGSWAVAFSPGLHRTGLGNRGYSDFLRESQAAGTGAMLSTVPGACIAWLESSPSRGVLKAASCLGDLEKAEDQ